MLPASWRKMCSTETICRGNHFLTLPGWCWRWSGRCSRSATPVKQQPCPANIEQTFSSFHNQDIICSTDCRANTRPLHNFPTGHYALLHGEIAMCRFILDAANSSHRPNANLIVLRVEVSEAFIVERFDGAILRQKILSTSLGCWDHILKFNLHFPCFLHRIRKSHWIQIFYVFIHCASLFLPLRTLAAEQSIWVSHTPKRYGLPRTTVTKLNSTTVAFEYHGSRWR